MHTATPVGLLNPFFCADALQTLTFANNDLWMTAGVIAGMQPDFMATLVNTAHKIADSGMLWFVLGVDVGSGPTTDKVKSAAHTRCFARIHQPVESVEGVAMVQFILCLETNPWSRNCIDQIPAYKKVSGHRPSQAAFATKSIGTRGIYVVAYDYFKLGLNQRQSRPKATNHLAQDAEPLIYDGSLKVAMVEGMTGSGRKTLMLVK
jgi:hypothetical protein